MTNLYDLIIIGAGPAGMTAAIYAARRKIKFLIISMDLGGQMGWSSDVENYPGIPDLAGIELVKKFDEHMKEYKIEVKSEEVLKLEKKARICVVKTRKKVYESKAIIIASGKSPRKLNVLGEEKYLGKGINYCATCDAPLQKGKTVVVVGSANSGLDACLFLSNYVKKIYLLDIAPKIVGEPYLRDKILKNKKISFIGSSKIKEVLGNKFVNGLKYEKDNKINTLKVDSVFVEIGLMNKSDFTNVRKNRWGEIMIFRSTITNEENYTNIPGIFAAGDCTDIPAKQIIAAAGEGCKAALASFDYINKWK
ncbi:MAG: FAD-dependent oxidoreductase [Candidatus Nanoarchaeia archaeon]|nr:FAD-dependent oxidoreductase [Candidatus Nanoarchaeia archaeon]MDD5741094.1 FAD-dependent oxidoreductase [Candidatus Nanoarchaeia archaeon]